MAADEELSPCVLYVSFQFGSEVAVGHEAAEAAVDLEAGPEEAAALGEGGDGVVEVLGHGSLLSFRGEGFIWFEAFARLWSYICFRGFVFRCECFGLLFLWFVFQCFLVVSDGFACGVHDLVVDGLNLPLSTSS